MDVCKHKMTVFSTIGVENLVIPNLYEIAYSFRVKTSDFDEQNVAFGRIKHFLELRVSNSVMMSRKHPKWRSLSKLDNNIFLTPGEPMDFPVACMIFKKLQAIVEDKFEIVALQISSIVGEQVEYLLTIDDQEEIESFIEEMPANDRWWNDPTPNTNKIQPFIDWEAVGLNWEQAKNPGSEKIARIIQFNPTVLEGGNKA